MTIERLLNGDYAVRVIVQGNALELMKQHAEEIFYRRYFKEIPDQEQVAEIFQDYLGAAVQHLIVDSILAGQGYELQYRHHEYLIPKKEFLTDIVNPGLSQEFCFTCSSLAVTDLKHLQEKMNAGSMNTLFGNAIIHYGLLREAVRADLTPVYVHFVTGEEMNLDTSRLMLGRHGALNESVDIDSWKELAE